MTSTLDIGKYIPLKSVVAMFMDQYSKSVGDEDSLWIMAWRALNLINRQFAALPKSVALPVEPNKTVEFPPDIISWSKIGIMDDNGGLSTLKINNSLAIWQDNDPNRLQYLTPEINTSLGILTGAPFFFNFYGNGVYYNTPLFGVQVGLLQYGEVRVDEANRVFVLPPDFKYQFIVVEYLSAPQKDPDYMVDQAMIEPVIAFLEWKNKLGTRQEFYAACTEARRTLPGKRITLQNIAQVIRETDGFYLKA